MKKKTSQISIDSPAKINLFLEVLSRREDGYHEVDTVLQEVTLADRLRIYSHEKEIKVVANSAELPSGKENLVYKAAIKLKKHYNVKEGAIIELEKNIPIAAGLGGGSSNAAKTLIGLNRLWGLGINEDELTVIAASLGADVPFFIKGGTAFCTGRGDRITRKISMAKPYWFVLVNPCFHVSTREVYASLNFPLTKYKTNISLLLNSLEQGTVLPELFFNRLEEVVLKRYPSLQQLKHGILESGALVCLISGSGPTLYAVTETERDAQNIQRLIGGFFKQEYFSVVCSGTSR